MNKISNICKGFRPTTSIAACFLIHIGFKLAGEKTDWWLAVLVFIVSTTLNYLDRSLLNVLAPMILKEFALNQQSFG